MKSLLIILSIITLSGCATVFSGTKTKVDVSGIPESAKVYYNGNYEGVAPCTVKVSKNSLKDGADITIKKEGYKDATVMLMRKTKVPAIIGDVLFTACFGLVIDFATGAIYRPYPGQVKFDLDKSKSAE